MKKTILIAIAFSLTVILSSCVRISKIEDNYEDAGYTYSEESSFVAESLLSEFDRDGIEVSIYAYTKLGRIAIVIEFDSEDDINTSLENNITLITLTNKYDINDITNKKFLVIPIATTEVGEQEIIDIFQD